MVLVFFCLVAFEHYDEVLILVVRPTFVEEPSDGFACFSVLDMVENPSSRATLIEKIFLRCDANCGHTELSPCVQSQKAPRFRVAAQWYRNVRQTSRLRFWL